MINILRRALACVGAKRTESLLVERHMLAQCQHYSSNEHVTGWMYSTADGMPSSWYRLLRRSETPHQIDHQFGQWLVSRGATVTTLTLVGERVVRDVIQSPDVKSRDELPVRAIFDDADAFWRKPRHSDGPDDSTRFKSAFEQLAAKVTESECEYLLLQRALLDVLLQRWRPGEWPVDVDALCRSNDGRIYLMETKQKYPARNGTFGLDKHYLKLLTWLQAQGPSSPDYVHLLMVNPLRDKHQSPLPLLCDKYPASAFVYWLAATLKPHMLAGPLLSTAGRDSGMHLGRRSQVSVRVEAFRVLGVGGRLTARSGRSRQFARLSDLDAAHADAAKAMREGEGRPSSRTVG